MSDRNKLSASERQLEQLHKVLAGAYEKSLEKMVADGEINASLLTSVANFLKQNGIECDPAAMDDLRELRDKAGNVLDFPFDASKEG